MAVSLRDAGCDLKTNTPLYLPVGPITLASPESMRLKSPDDKLDTNGIEEQANNREPSYHVLGCLDAVQVKAIAESTLETLRTLKLSRVTTTISQMKSCRMRRGVFWYQALYRKLLHMDNKNAPALLSRALGLKKSMT